MENQLSIYNSLNRTKEKFEPIHENHVGMYVCGPTVYSDVHLGNCRTFVSFDVIYRYLLSKGFKVRYVRNITDVGHLEGDTDIGAEDKIGKKARLEQLEPMEIVQRYSNGFHAMMRVFNTLEPSIEPRATGHIIEQIEMVQSILDRGYGYEKNGSVYFDTIGFAKKEAVYGKLSGRVIDDLLVETRTDLKHQSEKNHPSDFAIWIKADPSHLMRWNSPWSVGFPGWHLECSAMSTKYLGKNFDIHGGGNDLKFPHHENEIAQNYGACGCAPAKYWLHTNMLLMNGKKMSKSDGNSITPAQLFTGDSEHISKAYSPMMIRFFMLQSHYRSTLDLTDESLLAAEKAYRRLMEANGHLQNFKHSGGAATDEAYEERIIGLIELMYLNMDDDFNTPRVLATMFELVPEINKIQSKAVDLHSISAATLERFQASFKEFIYDILGLVDEAAEGANANEALDGLMELIIDLRQHSRANKDWATSDKIRDGLQALKIQLKDGKEGTTWSKE